MMGTPMNFSVAIMNPPYGSQHLPLLEKALKTSENVISIQPIRWMIDPNRGPDFKKYSHIKNRIHTIEKVPAVEATQYFNAAINMDLGIYDCKKEGNFDIENYAYLHENDYTFMKKVYKKIEDQKYIVSKYNNQKNFLVVSTIAGGHRERGNIPMYMIKKHFGYFIDGKNNDGLTVSECIKHNKHITNGKIENIQIWELPKENVVNAWNAIETNFFKFLCYFAQVDVHVHLNQYPLGIDYSSSWDDQKFYQYFELTNDEIKTIENWAKNNER